MLAMAVMDEVEQDLICRLFSIDLVQVKEKKQQLLSALTGTSIDHYVQDEYSDGFTFIYNWMENG